MTINQGPPSWRSRVGSRIIGINFGFAELAWLRARIPNDKVATAEDWWLFSFCNMVLSVIYPQTAVPSQNPIAFEERDCVASMREAHIHSIVPLQFETIMHAPQDLTTLQPKRLVNVCGLCFRSTSLCRLPILVPQICVLVIEIVIYLWRLCNSINLNIKFLLVPKMKSVKRSYILDRRYRIKYCSHHKPKL